MDWLRRREKRAPLLAMKMQNASWHFWRAALKGNQEYANRLLAKMKHDAWEQDRRFEYKFFVTYTFDAQQYTVDRVEAWQAYSKTISRALELIRKRTHFAYQWVLESTANGYPHAHIVFYTNKLFTPSLLKMKAGKKIYGGFEYRLFKKYAPAPVFAVEWAKGKGSTKYLMKYIAKSAKENIFEAPDPKNKKKMKAWTKNVLTLMCPTIAGCRAYGHSQYWRVPLLEVPTVAAQPPASAVAQEMNSPSMVFDGAYRPNFPYLFSTEEQSSQEFRYWLNHWKLFKARALTAEGGQLRRAALDWLLTNSEKNCLCTTRIAMSGEQKTAIEPFVDLENPTAPNLTEYVERHTSPTGCIDCLIKRLYRRWSGEEGVSLLVNPPIDLEKAEFHAAPSGEVRPPSVLRRQKQESAKRSAENSFRVAGFEYAFQSQFGKIENWTNKDKARAVRLFDALDAQKERRREREAAIKENRMRPVDEGKLGAAWERQAFVVRVGRKIETSGGRRSAWAYLKIDDFKENELVPHMEETENPELATQLSSELEASVFAHLYAQSDPSVDMVEWTLSENHSVIVGGFLAGR